MLAQSTDEPRVVLESLRPGVHHRAAGGVWVMAGRDLPAPMEWSSVPPAPSLSFIWGAGACGIRHADGTFELHPGALMWIAAGHPHRGFGQLGSDFVTLFVPAWDVPGERLGARLLPLSHARRELLLSVAAAVLAGRAHADIVAALAAVRPTAELGDAPRAIPRSLRAAKQLLDARFSKDVTLADLVEAGGDKLSITGLSRRFAEVWGIPPMHYRKQLRLLAATRLLLGGTSVTAAAHRAGFADAAHFSRCFRAQYGVSPSAWQRQVRGGLVDPGRI